MDKSIAKQLDLLLELQAIDKQTDEIIQMRGDLPKEVEGLATELTDLQARSQQGEDEIASLEKVIQEFRHKIKDIEKLVARYEEQQMKVRNNREYDAITKEVELQKLEIQLSEKKIKDAYERIEKQKVELNASIENVSHKSALLQTKQTELASVISDSQDQEQNLHKKREKASKNIESRLLEMYERIKRNVRNKIAVVLVKEGACTGCFTLINPQMQAEIREKNYLVSCEHCGRIIAAVSDPVPLDEEPEQATQ